MTENTINFNSLKFNLYEILNISIDSPENKIKKAYKNLILHFHPDKNNHTEEDIYQHILLANQILCNKDIRKKYDDYLLQTNQTFEELKNNFKNYKNDNDTSNKTNDISNKTNNTSNKTNDTSNKTNDTSNKTNDTSNKTEAKSIFDNKTVELTNKHINNFIETDILKNYEKLKKDREFEIIIDKESFKNIEEFNDKFENKIINKNFGDQIIPVNEDMRLSTVNINDNYTSLDIAFDNLYIDGGGIATSKYTSLEAAFKIQPLELNKKQVNIEDAIKDYKKNTDLLHNK
jgi:curved DNA-binding protein CbpA